MIKDILYKNEKVRINDEKIEELKQLIPNCFDKNGNLDIEILKREFKDKVDFKNESYELNFLGKSYAKLISALDTETVIETDIEHNMKEENKNSENIYITGDNLDGLKHLLKAYEGEIKCIYIDPPYNTGSDGFAYNDTFKFTRESLIQKLDITEEEADRILNMTSNNSSSHSAWLTFMYSRLYLSRQLLKEDGAIFISIDDNEQANLKILCDTIFGEDAFIGTITWEKRTKCQNTETSKDQFQSKTEYILLYTKKVGTTHFKLLKSGEKKYEIEDENGIYREKRLEEMSSVGMRGRKTMIFPILGILPSENKQWKYGKEYIEAFLKRKDVFIRDNKIYLKIRPYDEENEKNLPFWSHFFEKEVYGTAEKGKAELTSLFGNNEHGFETVKPTKLIKKILYHFDTTEEYIMDFFGGSSTTADAIMQLNSEDGGNRKYIIIQLPEKIKNNSDLNFKTIDEIGRRRIELSAEKIKEETQADIDYGFKHYILKNTSEELLNKMEKFNPEMILNDKNILSEYGKDAVLETWKLADGYKFNTNISEVELDGYIAYKCQDCLYMINSDLKINNIQTLLDKYNKDEKFTCSKLVIFGYSFRFDEIEMLKNNDFKVYTVGLEDDNRQVLGGHYEKYKY
jgi:adenine specific DNA methylase Mod